MGKLCVDSISCIANFKSYLGFDQKRQNLISSNINLADTYEAKTFVYFRELPIWESTFLAEITRGNKICPPKKGVCFREVPI